MNKEYAFVSVYWKKDTGYFYEIKDDEYERFK